MVSTESLIQSIVIIYLLREASLSELGNKERFAESIVGGTHASCLSNLFVANERFQSFEVMLFARYENFKYI